MLIPPNDKMTVKDEVKAMQQNAVVAQAEIVCIFCTVCIFSGRPARKD
jgi:hypothetical protein